MTAYIGLQTSWLTSVHRISCIQLSINNKYILGSHAKSNSSQLESKICNGHVARPGERKYMASLQLDGRHICSAGVFKKHFLLTTADCVWYIEHSTKETKQKATAVLGDINLKNGQRVDIVRMAYHPRFKSDAQFCSNNFCDFGIVMVR